MTDSHPGRTEAHPLRQGELRRMQLAMTGQTISTVGPVRTR